MNLILRLYRKLVPDQIRRAYNEGFQKLKMIYKNKRVMRKRSYGDRNKKEIFYVIRTDSTQSWGIATACSMVLNNIKYAVDRGWIPIVDYQNYYLRGIQDTKNRYQENAWEYYFEQPDKNYSLEEVYQSKNVILGSVRGQPYGSLSWNDVKNVFDDQYAGYFECAAKYLRIRPDILERAEEIRRTLFQQASGKKILGVGMRAGLYWGEAIQSDSYARHPKGLNIDEYIAYTHRFMQEYGCEYIFVSCDDRYYLERMKREFGDQCLYMSGRTLTHFFDREGNPIPENEKERIIEIAGQSIRERVIEYLIEIYLLSVCDSLFRVQGGGSLLACLLNNRRYEHYFMVDRGRQ